MSKYLTWQEYRINLDFVKYIDTEINSDHGIRFYFDGSNYLTFPHDKELLEMIDNMTKFQSKNNEAME